MVELRDFLADGLFSEIVQDQDIFISSFSLNNKTCSNGFSPKLTKIIRNIL